MSKKDPAVRDTRRFLPRSAEEAGAAGRSEVRGGVQEAPAPQPPTSAEEAGAAGRLEVRGREQDDAPLHHLVSRILADLPPDRPVLVLGIGNPDSPADSLGRRAARLLARHLPDDTPVRIEEATGNAFELLDLWQAHDHVHLIDACLSDDPPGTVHRFDATEAPLPVSLGSPSTHGYGVAEAVELARVLGRLPGRVVVWGIRPFPFDGVC